MAAATFEELKKQIEARVKKALVEDVAEVVKENESDTIERVVYGVYTPVLYRRRRDNGGMIDHENMRVNVLDNAIEVYNDTPVTHYFDKVDCSYHCPIKNVVSLDLLLEYGDGGPGGEYTHKHTSVGEPTFLGPRPFTKETINALKTNKQHVSALRDGLMRSGAKVKNG